MKYRTFTEAPVTKPFPPTGSLSYRCGAFDGRPMTQKEQWFEQFVNKIQARHDESSDLREWRRRKNHEEEAILLYHELGGNLQDYAALMETRDQQEFEYQCQRDKQKSKNLDPNEASRLFWARSQEWSMADKAEKEAREAEEKEEKATRIRINFARQVKAQAQASSNLVIHSEIITNAAGSQPPIQQSELKQPKPEKHGKVSQSVCSTGAGPSKQQVRKTDRNDKDICRQFYEQVQAVSPEKTEEQATATTTAIVTSAPLKTDAVAPLRVDKLNRPITAAEAAPIVAELAGSYGRVGILAKTHYPKGHILITNGRGLPKLYLGHPTVTKQRLLRNNGQGSQALRAHRVSASNNERSPTGPSTQQRSSEEELTPPSSSTQQTSSEEESTPPSSVRAAPSETPIEISLDALSISTVGRTNDDHNEGLGHVELFQAFDMMEPSTRTDPPLSTPSPANALSV